MTTLDAPVRRHALLSFFALTFAISWAGVVIVVGPEGFPGTAEEFESLLPAAILVMLAGPSIAGLVATALFGGTAGLRDLGSRLVRWRVGARWYAVALLTAPLVVTATLVALALASPTYRPGIATAADPVTHLVTGLLTGLAAGVVEEIGWTGFAIPAMRRRLGMLATGLVVGLLWGAWHLLVVWWGSTSSAGTVPMAVYLPVVLFSFLPPYRILMVWVHDRTGSLLVAMLMHASLTASVRILDPVGISGMRLLTYNLALAAALWGAVALVVVSRRRSTGRDPAGTGAARAAAPGR
jgi:uncharacterized protein